MKRYVLLLTFLNICFIVAAQAAPKIVCNYGFTFEVSMQNNWGYLQPVVTSVTPNTSAETAGMQMNDIIEKINDRPTKGENIETIMSWLNNSNDNIQLTVSNLKDKNQIKRLVKNCRFSTSIMERDLAGVYSFYSLEDVQTRAFTCPFKTTINSEKDFFQYASFGFSASDPNNLALERRINTSIQKCLEQKGLKFSERNPDLIIKTFYSHQANPNFRSNTQADKFPVESRYNVNTKSMETLPIYYNPLIHTNQARYFLKLGIQIIDSKNNSTVWECETNELLQADYSLADYAEFHIPLMFMQYPYPKSLDVARFYYSRSKYNFTGIRYNMDNLKEITEIVRSSPAEIAGVQPGDIIEKINNIKFISNTKTADNNYKQFIYKTLSLRDQSTQFTNAEGFTRCMYWDKMKYAQIYDEFRKPELATVFSYLFYFQPYVNLSGTNIVTFNIKRGRQKMEIKIKPVILSEEIFENL